MSSMTTVILPQQMHSSIYNRATWSRLASFASSHFKERGSSHSVPLKPKLQFRAFKVFDSASNRQLRSSFSIDLRSALISTNTCDCFPAAPSRRARSRKNGRKFRQRRTGPGGRSTVMCWYRATVCNWIYVYNARACIAYCLTFRQYWPMDRKTWLGRMGFKRHASRKQS